ncbi:MAG: hypothetical protein JSS29_11865 [Proteobacteria bacterium]|nr:hypothetical protein [Pseudomonadota bacterium]
MTERTPRRVAGLVLYVLGFLLLFGGVFQAIVALLGHAPVQRPLLFTGAGLALTALAGWAFASPALPAELLLTSTSFAALLTGVMLLFRALSGKPAAPVPVALGLASIGAVGLYGARRWARRRVFGRGVR